MPELDAMNPDMPQQEPATLGIPNGETDHEGAMAKADLYKLANYSFKLFKKLEDDAQLEAWVQAKITKAADYIASVYHYLEYEMKFNDYGQKLDNSDVMSESQKRVLKNKLMEAKAKIKALKVQQAEKSEDKKKVEEGIFGGHDQECAECSGTGKIRVPERQVPEEVKAKVEKYNRQAKAMRAASKRIDKNKNCIPDEDEMEEDFGGSSEKEMKVGDKKKTRTGELTKTSTGVIHKNTSYADDGEAEQKSGKGIKSHAKGQSAAEKKEKAPAQKMSPKSAKTWGMKDNEKFDNRDKEKEVDENYGQGVYEAKGKKPDFLDMDKDGDKKEPMKKAVADKKKNPFAKKVDEAKPSAGLSKAKKSEVVKDAKAGKDIGKPGKGFAKVEKAAAKSGAKDPKAVAAAAMWKNVKESVKVAEANKKAKPDFLDMDKDGNKEEPMKKAVADKKEVVKESAETVRIRQLMQRLNG